MSLPSLADRVTAAHSALDARVMFVVDWGDGVYAAVDHADKLPRREALVDCDLITAFGERFRFNEKGEIVEESAYDARCDLRFSWR